MPKKTARLSDATLEGLHPQIVRPTYDRGAIGIGIVHLGIGAFHRAHQAVYTDDALAGGPSEDGITDWAIAGASLRSPATAKALNPQDGLYALSVRDSDEERIRIIGAVQIVLNAASEAADLIDLMAAPTTRIVSITVTEKGYYLDPATHDLRLDDPAIASDLSAQGDQAEPATIYGLIAKALDRRRKASVPPFTVLCCDNLPGNGKILRRAMLSFAEARDENQEPGLKDWIADEVAFPSTMVDRITPATTDKDRRRITKALGLKDAWPVITEPFSQWVIEDNFTLGRPNWEAGGATFSTDIAAWEKMKLRMLNGAHSTIAYLGQLYGHDTVDAAMADERIASVVEGLWEETAETFAAPSDPADYAAALKKRFLNASLGHKTAQIAMDGSQKLPQRLLDPLRDRRKAGTPYSQLATAISAWMVYVARQVRSGGASALNDPLADQIAAAVTGAGDDTKELVAGLLSLNEIFGDDLANVEFLRRTFSLEVDRLISLTQAD